MGGFEFIFTFYSLLLGLAAANVATGLADVWRDRRGVALGWFVPVLGFIVLLLLMRRWVAYWNARELLTMTTPRLIMAACVALPFVFVSRLIFPHELESRTHAVLTTLYLLFLMKAIIPANRMKPYDRTCVWKLCAC